MKLDALLLVFLAMAPSIDNSIHSDAAKAALSPLAIFVVGSIIAALSAGAAALKGFRSTQYADERTKLAAAEKNSSLPPGAVATIAGVFGLSVLLGSGCAGFKEFWTPQKVQTLCQAAATEGATDYLAFNPQDRAKFERVYDELNALVATGTVTASGLHDVMASLPVNELRGKEAKIAVGTAFTVYNLVTGSAVQADVNTYTLAAATGTRDGLKVALGK